jgi:hypothetical protein
MAASRRQATQPSGHLRVTGDRLTMRMISGGGSKVTQTGEPRNAAILNATSRLIPATAACGFYSNPAGLLGQFLALYGQTSWSERLHLPTRAPCRRCLLRSRSAESRLCSRFFPHVSARPSLPPDLGGFMQPSTCLFGQCRTNYPTRFRHVTDLVDQEAVHDAMRPVRLRESV